MSDSYTIYVHEDGETWTMGEPIEVEVTPVQLGLIEGGEPVHNVVRDWGWTDDDRKASKEWVVTEEQRIAIGRYAKRYGFRLRYINVMMGVLGLPDNWASVVLNINDNRVLTAGIAPDGKIST